MRNLNTSPDRVTLRRLWNILLALLVLVCLATSANALSTNKAISEYVRDRWEVGQGFPGGAVNAIAQTPDGYLWIATEKGLVRFDGLSFVLIGQSDTTIVPFGPVLGLAVDAAGNLWIRLQGPNLVLRARDGTLQLVTPILQQAETDVTAMCTGTTGEILVSGLTNGVFRNSSGKFVPVVARAELPRLIISMAETADGKVWLGSREQGLYYFHQGQVSAFERKLPAKINTLLSRNGRDLWIGTDQGLVRWDGESSQVEIFKQLAGAQIVAVAADRDSNVWVGTSNGLARIDPAGAVSTEFGEEHSADAVNALFEDREGNLWVGTARGLERLRDNVFSSYSVANGLPSGSAGPLHVDGEGRTWFAPTDGGLYWLENGRLGRATAGKLRREVIYSIDGRNNELWLGGRGGLTQLRVSGSSFTARTYTEVDGLAQNRIYAVHQSRDGSVWAGTLTAGLSHLKNGKFTTYTRANGLVANTINAITESSDGTMWFGTPEGLSALSNGRWRTYTAQDGLSPGSVNCLFEDSSGALWIGTENGISLLRSGTIQIFDNLPDSLREEIFGIQEDNTGALWIATAKHILRVDRDKLTRGDIRMGDVIEYGLGDGLLSPEGIKRHKSVVLDTAGRIWFSTARGLSYVSPRSLKFSSAPALVHVDAILADGRQINLGQEIKVSAPHQRITLAYTALSLSVPARVRFMYRLDGFDQGWSQPTSAREAVYTNLEPRSYRFRVIASNSDGVWNSSEADLQFQIEPTLWQTAWFRLCAALIVVFAVLAFFWLRMLALARNMRLRFEERLAERTRIAQELHDTLLQGVISASMQLHVVAEQMPAGSTAKPAVERILALMGRVTEEGRNAVKGLRTRQNNCTDLGRAFSEIQQEFGNQEKIGFHVLVEGHPRPLHPVIRDEIYSIGREALTNAFRHARAENIEVELEYASHGLRLLVRDSGVGFDSDVLRFGRDGHWGLAGMRERAKRIGAKFRVLSRPAAGTEVELIVPGPIAFVPEQRKRASNWLTRIMPIWKHVVRSTSNEHKP